MIVTSCYRCNTSEAESVKPKHYKPGLGQGLNIGGPVKSLNNLSFRAKREILLI